MCFTMSSDVCKIMLPKKDTSWINGRMEEGDKGYG
jgi:hypothetical protein